MFLDGQNEFLFSEEKKKRLLFIEQIENITKPVSKQTVYIKCTGSNIAISQISSSVLACKQIS